MTTTANMSLLERLRKGANCVGFLDGAPEPAADVADMMRKAADEIERLRNGLRSIIAADDEFKASLGPHWDGDPVSDACDKSRDLLLEK